MEYIRNHKKLAIVAGVVVIFLALYATGFRLQFSVGSPDDQAAAVMLSAKPAPPRSGISPSFGCGSGCRISGGWSGGPTISVTITFGGSSGSISTTPVVEKTSTR